MSSRDFESSVELPAPEIDVLATKVKQQLKMRWNVFDTSLWLMFECLTLSPNMFSPWNKGRLANEKTALGELFLPWVWWLCTLFQVSASMIDMLNLRFTMLDMTCMFKRCHFNVSIALYGILMHVVEILFPEHITFTQRAFGGFVPSCALRKPSKIGFGRSRHVVPKMVMVCPLVRTKKN